MGVIFKIKHHFFSAFREFFVHHHGSLEFRAKIFALVIAVNDEIDEDNYTKVKEIGMSIYNEDKNRANLLMLSTQELVQKVKNTKNNLDIDSLVYSLQKELKIIPRYAEKIDIQALKLLLSFSHNKDTISYQENILEFLETTKQETLN